jgi:hypothetical protein
MPSEEIIVLANSRKPGGRCVAGISTGSGDWVRPVAARSSSGALSPRDCCVDGRMVEELDIVRFNYTARVGDPAQPENVAIEERDWELIDRVAPQDAYRLLRPHLEPGPALLGGTERGVPEALAQEGMEASLALVEPDTVMFRSQDNPFEQGRQARAVFVIASQPYDLGITDRAVAPRVKDQLDGTYSPSELGFGEPAHTVLTVSLAEPFNENRWKLAAAVLFLP